MMMMMSGGGGGGGGDAGGSPADESAAAATAAAVAAASVREQDRLMPIANVIRIMRRVLPAHAKISDDAKETIQECVSEFISFITSEANDKCQREQRKTITAEDVLWAMSKLGFDDYVEPLALFLHKYREVEGDHRGSIRGEPLAKKPAPDPQQHHDQQPSPQQPAMASVYHSTGMSSYYQEAFVHPTDAYAAYK